MPGSSSGLSGRGPAPSSPQVVLIVLCQTKGTAVRWEMVIRDMAGSGRQFCFFKCRIFRLLNLNVTSCLPCTPKSVLQI